ncbi:hypothetical protein K9B33_05500 [Sphingobium sp. 3R8]|uniref:hypothetical protein n=1 Tax=Sphingobium sp. 3R8 TaxID=2874921 RepID=UPI001CCB8EBD|nr:hypothetical protein [Sphingobium sp. 3R8]MBZ9646991.1 hypothetical protein [Sphingobium sp. 3R8]
MARRQKHSAMSGNEKLTQNRNGRNNIYAALQNPSAPIKAGRPSKVAKSLQHKEKGGDPGGHRLFLFYNCQEAFLGTRPSGH